jgi:hypothetical protein
MLSKPELWIPSAADQSEGKQERGNAGDAESELTVLAFASLAIVVIEPEAPEDGGDCPSLTERATDDDDDDDNDDDGTRNCESTAGSPTATATSDFAVPVVSRGGVRPAKVIEVMMCGSQRARLDVDKSFE